nr:MAG TPA: hypothetical protein [Caudoviricetes sp.]
MWLFIYVFLCKVILLILPYKNYKNKLFPYYFCN